MVVKMDAKVSFECPHCHLEVSVKSNKLRVNHVPAIYNPLLSDTYIEQIVCDCPVCRRTIILAED